MTKKSLFSKEWYREQAGKKADFLPFIDEDGKKDLEGYKEFLKNHKIQFNNFIARAIECKKAGKKIEQDFTYSNVTNNEDKKNSDSEKFFESDKKSRSQFDTEMELWQAAHQEILKKLNTKEEQVAIEAKIAEKMKRKRDE